MPAVRRACSLLPTSSGAYSALADDATKITEKQEPSCQLNKGISLSKRTSTNNESERNEKMPSTKKGSHDHSGMLETLATDVPLCQPKDILEQLALPRAWSLDSLLSQPSTSKILAAMRSYDHSAFPSYNSTCPPPFPWSVFPVGSSKPSNDSSKVSANKNVPLHKWVKMDSWNGHIRNVHGHPLNQDSMVDTDNAILKKLEIDRNKGNVLSSVPHCLSSSVLTKPPVKSCCPSEVDLRRSGLDSQLEPFVELHSGKFVNHIEDVEGGHKHESSERLCSVEEQRSFSVLRNLVTENENPSARTCEYDDNNSCLHSDPSVSRCDLQLKYLTPSDNSTVGKMLVEHSPRMLAAAQILYEISSCQDAMRKQSGRYGKIRWPCKPSQKVMKAPRTKASQVGKETSITTDRSVKKIDPVKVLDNVSLLKPDVFTVERKSNSAHVASVQRDTVKWSIPSSRKPSQVTQISIKKSRQRKLGIPWPATGAAAYRSQ
ncbi:hypothetical protein EJ110_NYTH10822 [Nymphaea thermarum]|nr:hypothetical protein EJ110_NYTH10822 [Nymphaea thermarum]